MALKPPSGPNVPVGKGQVVYNAITDFGAGGNGSTDDTDELNRAIGEAHTAGGGIVFLPTGIYTVNSSLNMMDGVHLWGPSANFRDTTLGTTIQTSSAGALVGVPIVNVNKTKFAGVHNLTLVAAGADATANTTLGISDFNDPTYQATFLVVEDCTFNYIGGVCIGLYGDVNYIMRNRRDNGNSHFIHLKNSITGVGQGSDNFVAWNESGAVTGNGSGTAVGDGIRVEDGGENSIAFNHIYNHRYGISLVGSTFGAYYNRVIGNRCEKHDHAGIYLNAGGRNQIISNNVFNNGYAGSSPGIDLVSTESNLVSSNYIYNEATFPGGTNTDTGIQLSSASTLNDIKDNFVRNVNLIGIKLDGGTFNKVSDNRIHTCGQEGIYLTNSSNDNQVDGNNVYKAGQTTDNTYDGIAVLGSSSTNLVTGNHVRHGGGTNRHRYGINVIGSGATNNSVISNGLQNAGRTSALNDTGTGTRTESNPGQAATTVASAATITVTGGVRYASVTGTTNITSMTATYVGHVITLVFAGILTFTDGSNLKLAGNFVTTADDSITLVCDGTNWVEIARSVN